AASGALSSPLDPGGESLDELRVGPWRAIPTVPGLPGPPDQRIRRHVDEEVRIRSRLALACSALEAVLPGILPLRAELTGRRRSRDGLVGVLGHGPMGRARGHVPP